MSKPGTSGTTITQTNTMITETNTTLPSIQSLSVAGNPKAVKDSIVYSAGSFEEIRVARNHRPGWVTPEQNTLDYGTPDNQNIPNFSKLESFAKTQQSSETIIIRKEQTSTSSISNFIKKTEECHVPKKKVVSFSTSTDSTHIEQQTQNSSKKDLNTDLNQASSTVNTVTSHTEPPASTTTATASSNGILRTRSTSSRSTVTIQRSSDSASTVSDILPGRGVKDGKNMLAFLHNGNSFAVALYVHDECFIRWNENNFGNSEVEFKIDHILLPILIQYKPSYLLVPGKHIYNHQRSYNYTR